MRAGTEFNGFGFAAPDRVVTNREIEAQLNLESGWIERRTGICERRWASEGEKLTDLATRAGKMALDNSSIAKADIALTLLATSTPDHLLPPSAPLLAEKLGLGNTGAIDMAGACAGFLYALTLADSFARVHSKSVLIVAANILSRRINPKEYASAVLFADAAGAVIVSPTERNNAGLVGSSLASEGSAYELIQIPSGGSAEPFSPDLALEDTRMTMRDGRTVFIKAIDMMSQSALSAIAQANLTASDIDHFVPHQANSRIINAIANKLEIPDDVVWSTVGEFGNSSAATIPFTLARVAPSRGLKPNQKILMSAAGAGLVGGSLVWIT
ncbi:MAG: beta-ketoacyl-ACP synthase III [Hyphomicrobiaceae bacterium]